MALVKMNWHPSPRELRQFAGIWFPAFCVLVAAVLWFRFHFAFAAAGVIALAIVIAGLGLARPAIVRPLYVGWMAASFPIGWLLAHLFLAAIFYLVITPIGCLMRLCGRDPLTRRFDRSKSSYWIDREPDDDDNTKYFRPY